jgi:transaldolase
MKLFLDTASLKEIRAINEWGILSGLTSNPTLIAKEHSGAEAHMKSLCTEVNGPVSLETTRESAQEIYAEGMKLASIAPNVVVKVAATPEGFKAGKRLASVDIPVNVTLVFSPAQALVAAEMGATYVSPFLGRLDDIATNGLQVLAEIIEIYRVQEYETQVLAASLRHPVHVVEAARLGADVATMPFAVMMKLMNHPLTEFGLERFLSDWRALQEELDRDSQMANIG